VTHNKKKCNKHIILYMISITTAKSREEIM